MVGRELAAPRSIPIGGNALTSSVASVLNVPVEEAEEQKRYVDVSPDQQHADSVAGMVSAPDPARQVTLPFVDELIRELRRSIMYFQSQAAEAGMAVQVERLILAGGGTQLPGLPEYLGERLGMEIRVLNPLEGPRANPTAAAQWSDRGPELAVAMGLALKEYN